MTSGAFLAVGPCCGCGQAFGFDPDTVPSIPIDPATNLPPDLCDCDEPVACAVRAVNQPVCPECMRRRESLLRHPSRGRE